MLKRSDRGKQVSLLLVIILSCFCCASSAQDDRGESLLARTIGIAVDPSNGTYTVFDPVSKKPIFQAAVGAQVDHRWIKSSDYPRHSIRRESVADDLGARESITVTNEGLANEPELICSLHLHAAPDFVTITVTLKNTATQATTVQAIRSVASLGSLNLGGSDADDRVLSDSFSEDRPAITIHDLPDATNGMHRAVGSQLIYNRNSNRDLFLGTLSSEKFLTVLRLHIDKDHIASYEVDSTGTTELEKENSLQDSPAEDHIELTLPLGPGAELSSERLLISTGTDYLTQLEDYGSLIRQLHHPRVVTHVPAGWWSWTAYYFGLNQGTALTNANWMAENLKKFGYDFFHIDEGYEYARGEYTTPNATLFPDGMRALERKITRFGLIPGIWTAPFDVSERAWVYEHHKDWLVHNAAGQPIHAGWVSHRRSQPSLDHLFVLDTTNPAAQDYLRQTYSTLAKDWGIRYIKLDFMDDTAIEGYYHKPNTTALEAQRIGLQVIREAVGDNVLLDKDGSPMLNPVGLVDTGRISQDTGHKFIASRDAAPGIAARFFMNGNYYLADPDAFTVSGQTVADQDWHGGVIALTLDEAKVSIALAAITGGMYEIGDDLPILGSAADRLALVKNQDLLNMARLGRSSRPLDLMSYTPVDGMPSIFLLQESKRQSILTVFNWTEKETEHKLDLDNLGLRVRGHNRIFDVFESKQVSNDRDSVDINLAPHSVTVLKIIDTSISPAPPTVEMKVPGDVRAGEIAKVSVQTDPAGVPSTTYRWDFGDGTTSTDQNAEHAYTHAGSFTIRLHVDGLDGVPLENQAHIEVKGKINTRFSPSDNRRFTDQ